MSTNLRFLSLQNVLQIHGDTIREEGGSDGVRDMGLLESAVAMPQAFFDGQYLHVDIAAKAVAYLFHLCANHPFIDGNKRAATLSLLVFLIVNGYPDTALPSPDELEQATMHVAQSEWSKDALTDWLRLRIG